jgi:hypothetical protein
MFRTLILVVALAAPVAANAQILPTEIPAMEVTVEKGVATLTGSYPEALLDAIVELELMGVTKFVVIPGPKKDLLPSRTKQRFEIFEEIVFHASGMTTDNTVNLSRLEHQYGIEPTGSIGRRVLRLIWTDEVRSLQEMNPHLSINLK